MQKVIRILLIDQDEKAVRDIRDVLDRPGHETFEIVSENSLAQGLARVCEGGIDLILLDLTLPDGKGLHAISEIYRHAAQIPVIAMNIADSDELAQMAVREGAQDFFCKATLAGCPLARMILFAIERKQTEKQLARLASFAWQNPNPIIETDSKGNLIYLNPAAQNLFPELQQQKEEHPFLNGLRDIAVLLQNRHQTLEVRGVEIGGSFYEQHISYVPENDVIRSYIIDHTERRAAEEKLVAHTHEMERMNRLMVGREIKMKELKQIIKRLEERRDRAA